MFALYGFQTWFLCWDSTQTSGRLACEEKKVQLKRPTILIDQRGRGPMVTKQEILWDELILHQILAQNPKMDVDRAGEAACPRYGGYSHFCNNIQIDRLHGQQMQHSIKYIFSS